MIWLLASREADKISFFAFCFLVFCAYLVLKYTWRGVSWYRKKKRLDKSNQG